jgi:hypothetical protein
MFMPKGIARRQKGIELNCAKGVDAENMAETFEPMGIFSLRVQSLHEGRRAIHLAHGLRVAEDEPMKRKGIKSDYRR